MASFLSRQNIKQASIIIAVFTISSQFFGVFREMILANFFGTSAEYDILILALAIPLMFMNVLFMSVPAAGIPYLQNPRQPLNHYGIFRGRFFKANTILLFIFAAIVFIFLPDIIKILKGNLGESEVNQVTTYGRIFCLLIPLKGYEAVFRSLLHLKRHFIFPAATNMVFNVLMIAILLALFPSLASWAFILAWLVGTFIQTLLVIVPSYLIYSKNAQTDTIDDFRTASYMKYLSIIIAIETLGLCLLPFDRYLCGLYLNAGYVSSLNYADAINSVPFRIFAISMGTAIFPDLTEKASKGDFAALSRLYHKAVAVCLAIILPIVVFFSLFKGEIVRILFQRGRFDAFSSEITVAVLSYLLVGLIFMSLFFIQARVLYAIKSWRSLILVKSIALVFKVVFGFMFITKNWALAVSGGTLIMYASSFIMTEAYLYFRLKLRYTSADFTLIGKSLVSSLSVCAILFVLYLSLRGVMISSAVMFIAGALGFAVWVLLDQKLNVSGIKLTKLLIRRS